MENIQGRKVKERNESTWKKAKECFFSFFLNKKMNISRCLLFVN